MKIVFDREHDSKQLLFNNAFQNVFCFQDIRSHR